MIASRHRSRGARAIGLVAACLLSWQAIGIVPAPGRVPSCCCLRMQAEKKRCPVCAHAKEIESGLPLVKTCGLHDPTSTAFAFFLPAIPPPLLAKAAPVAKQALPQDAIPPLAPAPALEVPTPPPLA